MGKGSIAFWDNRAVQHFAASDYYLSARIKKSNHTVISLISIRTVIGLIFRSLPLKNTFDLRKDLRLSEKVKIMLYPIFQYAYFVNDVEEAVQMASPLRSRAICFSASSQNRKFQYRGQTRS